MKAETIRSNVMKARDVMVSPVITVKPSAAVKDVAKLFLARHISGAPVVDDSGKVVGIVTEGDLMFRAEIGTQRPHPIWFRQLAGEDVLAAEYVKARARTVADVMSRNLVTAAPDASLNEVAALLERNAIKRLPIMRGDELVGIVSRANILQALASTPKELAITPSDSAIRASLLEHLKAQRWAHTSRLNVIVHDGVVELWGTTTSAAEKQALRVAAESTQGVRAVNDHLFLQPAAVVPAAARDIVTR